MCAAQYLPGTASLIEELDKKLMVLLRDGRTLIGYLRSVDQFANLVLHRTIERIHVGSDYGDIPRGIFVVRGENVVRLTLPNIVWGHSQTRSQFLGLFLIPSPFVDHFTL